MRIVEKVWIANENMRIMEKVWKKIFFNLKIQRTEDTSKPEYLNNFFWTLSINA